MEKQPKLLEPEIEPHPKPQQISILSPSSSGRRSNIPNSPEFEFWMVRNPSFPQPNLLSADELFVDGIILPLCLLSHHPDPPDDSKPQQNPPEKTPISEPEPEQEPEPETGREPGPEPGPGPESSTVLSTSKRWRDIFKVGDKKTINKNQVDKGGDNKETKKKDRKSSSSGTNNSAELNINIWPFSRSRSAGNSGNRPKMAATRKVSSAPCSRSNSGGESKSKKWPSSPSRGGGIHLGRSSPVWQVRRGGTGAKSSEAMVGNAEKKNGVKKDGLDSRWSKSRLGVGGGGGGGGSGSGSGGGGLNLNVQMCMGYRQNSSCRSDENSSLVGGGEQSCSGGAAGNGGSGVKLFNLRTLFSKKVY